MARNTPYPAFNFEVNFDGAEAFGGFSDVSGLGTELTIAEYREGRDKENHVRKIQGIHKVSDVTLKRGVVDSMAVWQWIEDSRILGPEAKKKSVVIKLLDEAHKPVQSWILRNVVPMKYTGPTLAAKGGGDVSMEELVLSVEAISVEKA
jgi:phage tail-like protein